MTTPRPTSVASAVGIGPGHRRAVSSRVDINNGFKPQVASVASLFLTNLRLLNLDLLSDWPAPNPATFAANSDTKSRIKCSEWALYHLFRLYDGALTAEKLQPFFPPLEPLQSVNLRAALYRCLDQLKKNGILGREIMLRKTMLDECLGDKFLDLCLSFSAIVLRKITLERKTSVGHHRRVSSIPRPVAQNLGSAQALKKGEKESLLPLAIAHKAALTSVLKEKDRKRQSFARLSVAFAAKEEDLYERGRQLESDSATPRHTEDAKDLQAVEKTVEKNWAGNSQLRDSVLMGDEISTQDALLQKSFDDVWIENELQTSSAPLETSAQGTLESLHAKAQEQSDRLQKWQDWHREMQTPPSPQPRSPSKADNGQNLRLNLHRRLTIRNGEHHARLPSPEKENVQPVTMTGYDDILNAMRENLRRNTATRRDSIQVSAPLSNWQLPPRRQASTSVASESNRASQHLERQHGRHGSELLQRTISVSRGGTVPIIRPGLVRRSSSRNYQPTRIEKQTAPIPLKSEIFSPFKRRQGSTFSAESESPNGSVEHSDASSFRRGSQSSAKSRSADSVVSLGADSDGKDNECSIQNCEPTLEDVLSKSITRSWPSTYHGQDNTTISDSHDKKAVPQASLTERTRQSMAFPATCGKANSHSEDAKTQSHPSRLANLEDSSAGATRMDLDNQTSLLERTRQSISLAPQLPPNLGNQRDGSPERNTGRIRHSRSRTSIFPVNQFETPAKKRRSSFGTAWLEGDGDGARQSVQIHDSASFATRRNITPREKLFHADAEYDSVFKSRPKIAQSPPSMIRLQDDGGRREEDSFIEDNSPLVGIAR